MDVARVCHPFKQLQYSKTQAFIKLISGLKSIRRTVTPPPRVREERGRPDVLLQSLVRTPFTAVAIRCWDRTDRTGSRYHGIEEQFCPVHRCRAHRSLRSDPRGLAPTAWHVPGAFGLAPVFELHKAGSVHDVLGRAVRAMVQG